jgi:hypothetical protein
MNQNMTLACPAYLHGFKIDGNTNPASWGDSIQIIPGGSITTVQDGIKTVITQEQPCPTSTPIPSTTSVSTK